MAFLSAGGTQPSWYTAAPYQCAFVWLPSYLRKVETAFVFLSPVRGIYSLPLTSAAKRAGSWTLLPGGAATSCGPCSFLSLFYCCWQAKVGWGSCCAHSTPVLILQLLDAG